MSQRYQKSEALLERALKVIPLGSQTFSKSITQYPLGVSPYFIERGQGCRVWDVDGNEYIDMVSSLAAITLGYNDPDVDAAVIKQMKSGVIFSLPHRLEVEVAEKIVEMVPCAEMVRYGKNGSDATAGAVRVARAYTDREHVAVCGYHGWQDWYIGSTARHQGVPLCTRQLTHTFEFNNLPSLERILAEYRSQVAAIILEPMAATPPAPGFLEGVQQLARENGAVFILDETVTGFRYARGGAQEYFGITPDLATFGKGISNGYPISVVTGKAEIMRLMEEIFFSFTFGGEALSLAAALATMEKLQREPVIETNTRRGIRIIDGLNTLIAEFGLEDVFSTAGHPSWSFLLVKDARDYGQWEIKTLVLQEMLARGILTLGTHNMNYSHGDEEIAILLQAYREVMGIVREALEKHCLEDYLRCKPLVPLFRVR